MHSSKHKVTTDLHCDWCSMVEGVCLMNIVYVVQEVVTFRTVDPAGADVYHTNVMMAIGTDVAVVCAEAVPDEKQRKHLLERLNRHHKVSTWLTVNWNSLY